MIGCETGLRCDSKKEAVRGGYTYDVHDAQEFDLQPLSELRFKLLGSTAADIHVAENAVWDLNQRTEVLDNRVLADAMYSEEVLDAYLQIDALR